MPAGLGVYGSGFRALGICGIGVQGVGRRICLKLNCWCLKIYVLCSSKAKPLFFSWQGGAGMQEAGVRSVGAYNSLAQNPRK